MHIYATANMDGGSVTIPIADICDSSSAGLSDAAYITAAHPGTTLALLAALDERDAENARLREARTVAIQQMCEHARAAGSWQGMAEGKDIVIRQLEAEVASLRECNAELQMSAGAADLAVQRVTAERDRMREALQRIAGISNECTWTPRMRPLAAELQDIIRTALSGGAP